MAWKPGQSGNPAGRRAETPSLTTKVRKATRDGAELIEIMLRIARGQEDEAKIHDRISAVRWLADRGFGKVAESLEIAGKLTLDRLVEESWRKIEGERDDSDSDGAPKAEAG